MMDKNALSDNKPDRGTGLSCEKTYKSLPENRKPLVKRFKNGDTNAFRTIYMQWYDPILYLLRRITRSEQDAEDLAQDVFSTLWMQRESIDPEKDIRAYIFTMARRTASKHIRRIKIQNNYLSDYRFDDSEERDQIIAKEMELLTEYVISKMPAQRREAFLLSLNEGLTPAEIAERLNISPKNARNFVYQARKELKEILTLAMLFWTMAY
ncbi:sigma-70 family RNA polymerase sigma factor [uncultured Alistipes sp.]|jgi:RNA polymerase sigma factor, sigma-70 family|uniref:RNA polymerase sigma factor n=1 Tax=uncultured Alistipes sp. TaxID=538949 RepID=UPI0027D98417|nr:sigma-70 family RNA polymerase sigma factor [uncultured Alistipes sp.]